MRVGSRVKCIHPTHDSLRILKTYNDQVPNGDDIYTVREIDTESLREPIIRLDEIRNRPKHYNVMDFEGNKYKMYMEAPFQKRLFAEIRDGEMESFSESYMKSWELFYNHRIRILEPIEETVNKDQSSLLP